MSSSSNNNNTSSIQTELDKYFSPPYFTSSTSLAQIKHFIRLVKQNILYFLINNASGEIQDFKLPHAESTCKQEVFPVTFKNIKFNETENKWQIQCLEILDQHGESLPLNLHEHKVFVVRKPLINYSLSSLCSQRVLGNQTIQDFIDNVCYMIEELKEIYHESQFTQDDITSIFRKTFHDL